MAILAPQCLRPVQCSGALYETRPGSRKWPSLKTNRVSLYLSGATDLGDAWTSPNARWGISRIVGDTVRQSTGPSFSTCPGLEADQGDKAAES